MTVQICLLMFVLCASGANCQTIGVEYVAATELRSNMAGASQTQQRLVGKLLGSGEYRYMTIRRDRTSQVQAHAAWDEIFIVQDGQATMLYGGQFIGGRAVAAEERGGGPGEMRGGELAGGTKQELATGDLLIIPAGVAHQVHVEPGKSVTYLSIKVGRDMQSASGKD